MARCFKYRITPGATAQVINDVNVGPEPEDLLDHLKEIATGLGHRAVAVRPHLTIRIENIRDEPFWMAATMGLAEPLLIFRPNA